MGDMLKLIWWAVIGLFRSRASLEAEILTLRHQLNVLRRKSPKRLTFSNFDRLVFATLYRFAPHCESAPKFDPIDFNSFNGLLRRSAFAPHAE
jgi:hypothetical protein